MNDRQQQKASWTRQVAETQAGEQEVGTGREAYPGHLFADGQDRIIETAYWLGTSEAWESSPQKASGKYNSCRTRFGLVLALRTTGI